MKWLDQIVEGIVKSKVDAALKAERRKHEVDTRKIRSELAQLQAKVEALETKPPDIRLMKGIEHLEDRLNGKIDEVWRGMDIWDERMTVVQNKLQIKPVEKILSRPTPRMQ